MLPFPRRVAKDCCERRDQQPVLRRGCTARHASSSRARVYWAHGSLASWCASSREGSAACSAESDGAGGVQIESLLRMRGQHRPPQNFGMAPFPPFGASVSTAQPHVGLGLGLGVGGTRSSAVARQRN
jgi:hypothetical protein